MKLFMCFATSIDYEPNGLIVANDKEKAVEKFKQQLDEEDVWYTGTVHVEEITEIDGYKIELNKMDI